MSKLERPSPLYNALPVQPNAQSMWTTRLELPSPRPRQEILHLLGQFAAATLDPYMPLSGYIKGDEDVNNGSAIILARDPSGKLGTPLPELCDELADGLAAEHGLGRKPETVAADFRVILGRTPGYGDDTPYTMDGVRDRIPEDSGLEVAEGHLFSVRYGRKPYDEPAAVVTGPTGSLGAMAELAYDLRQLRYVVETPEQTVVNVINE